MSLPRRPKPSPVSLGIRIASLIVAMIGLAVIWAWATGNQALIFVEAGFSPMKFNTALCLFLSAISLFTLDVAQRRIAFVASSLASILAFASLMQYILGIDLRIDELFVKAFEIGSVEHPGRMAPNTSAAILLANIVLLCFALPRSATIGPVAEPLCTLLGSLIAALGAVPLIGYLGGIQTAYTWGAYSGMAVHTAFCIVLLGVGIVALVWRKSATSQKWLPIPVAIGFLIIAASTTQAVQNYEDQNFDKNLNAETGFIAGRVNDRLSSFFLSVDRITHRWEMGGGTPEKIWESDATTYLHVATFLKALEWVDRDQRLQWVEPHDEYASQIGEPVATDGLLAETAKRAIADRDSRASPPIDLPKGGKGFVFMSPIFLNDKFDGFIVGLFRLDELFQKIMLFDKANSYYVTVREDGQVVYTNVPEGVQSATPWQKKAELHSKGTTLEMTVDPTPAELATKNDQLPTLLLVMGVFAAVFGALSIFLATKWRHNAAVLKDSEEQFRSALEYAPIGMGLIDPHGRWLRVNEAICKLTGYTSDELLRLDFQSITHPDDLEEDLRNARALMDGVVTSYQIEKRYIHKEGHVLHVRLSVSLVRTQDGEPKYFISQIEDITARRHDETERAKLLAIIEESADYVGTADMSGRLLYHNRGARRMLGLPDDFDMTLMKISDMHPQWAMDLIEREAIPAIFEKGTWLGHTAVLHRNGQEIPVSQALTLMRDAEGNPLCLTTVIRDISDLKKVERMKNEFVAMVSHELRTPLTSIRGALGLIAGGMTGPLPPKTADLVNIAHKNSERLVRIINDILDIEKLESGKMEMKIERVEVASFLKAALDANAGYGEKYNVTFVACGEIPSDPIMADPDRLMQVFANILSNAAKYTPSGGEVHVHAQHRGTSVRFRVQDYGPGIPPEFQDRIFQKFAQADSPDTRRHDGTGLGLSISKKFIEAMGGEIDFTTESGVGTTFFFDLPVATGHAVPAGSADRTVASAPHILVCEDDPDVAHLLQLMLENNGYSSETALTLKEVRKKIQSGRFAAILLDLIFPDGNGVEIVRELKADILTQNLPIIIVSARADEGRRMLNGDAVGVVDWLVKPISENEIMDALKRATTGTSLHRVLHVEDDRDLSKIVEQSLHGKVELVLASTIRDARIHLLNGGFDLVLLDLGMPDGSGIELLGEINKLSPHPIPVLILSAREVDIGALQNVAASFVKSRVSETHIADTILSLVAKEAAQPGVHS